MVCHTQLLPQPPSLCSVDPPDCTILCSSILDPAPVVKEYQAINEVDVAQPTCAIIYDEYDQGSESQPTMKDDLLMSVPQNA